MNNISPITTIRLMDTRTIDERLIGILTKCINDSLRFNCNGKLRFIYVQAMSNKCNCFHPMGMCKIKISQTNGVERKSNE